MSPKEGLNDEPNKSRSNQRWYLYNFYHISLFHWSISADNDCVICSNSELYEMNKSTDFIKPVCRRCLGSGREPSSGHQTVDGWQDHEACSTCRGTGIEPTNTDAALADLRAFVCMRLAYDDGLKGRQARFVIESDIDGIMTAILAYTHRYHVAGLKRLLPFDKPTDDFEVMHMIDGGTWRDGYIAGRESAEARISEAIETGEKLC
jgi:hypothetical protein